MDLFDAIRERRERAVEVRETYEIEHAGAQCWVVLHPDEPERCYLVDMLARHCSCPDWSCTAAGLGIDCKHIIAVAPLWETLTGLRFERQTEVSPHTISYDSLKRKLRVSGRVDRETGCRFRFVGGSYSSREGWAFPPTSKTAAQLMEILPSAAVDDRSQHLVADYYSLVGRGRIEPYGEIG